MRRKCNVLIEEGGLDLNVNEPPKFKEAVYIEDCYFHGWFTKPHIEKIPVDDKVYQEYAVDLPHALVEMPNGVMDLVHYKNVKFINESKFNDFAKKVRGNLIGKDYVNPNHKTDG